MPDALPIVECLDELTSVLAQAQPVVLQAPPGAGKTTGIPPALLNSKAVGDGKTLLIQPRRIAARAAAHRLASAMNCRLGDTVGYHVRFDRCHGKDTRLISMTTGMLLRRIQADPFLEDVSCVVLDEFYERSLEIDLALGMLQRIRTTLRPELRLLVMSATLSLIFWPKSIPPPPGFAPCPTTTSIASAFLKSSGFIPYREGKSWYTSILD